MSYHSVIRIYGVIGNKKLLNLRGWARDLQVTYRTTTVIINHSSLIHGRNGIPDTLNVYMKYCKSLKYGVNII